PAALAAEAKRVYDICAGCRRCYNLCPSFNYLLDTADEQHDGDGAALTPAEDGRVVDLCFGCNLCYPHCPYTPPHRWAVDFPRLMQDARIARAAGEGIRLRDRILGNPELLGRLGSALPRLANWANRNRWLRWGMETALGPLVEQGYDVVVPGPSCSRMLKQDYPRLVPGAATERVAGRVFDLAEYLMRLDGEGKLAREFRGSLGKVAYQAPCHLRVQE